jgi:hypothetical protein
MAGFTSRTESCCDMIDNFRRYKITLMTCDTGGAQSGERTGASALVAGFAGYPGMSSDQGEPVCVLPNRLYGDVPAANGMAIVAIPSKLPAMNIRVTRRAILADFLELKRNVARCAGDGLVKPS